MPWSVNLYWSLADLWQVLIPLAAFKSLKADVALRSKRDFGVFLLFSVVLNNLAGASWGATMFLMSGQFPPADFTSVFSNWFLGNIVVTLLITLLLLRFVTPAVRKIWKNTGWV